MGPFTTQQNRKEVKARMQLLEIKNQKGSMGNTKESKWQLKRQKKKKAWEEEAQGARLYYAWT